MGETVTVSRTADRADGAGANERTETSRERALRIGIGVVVAALIVLPAVVAIAALAGHRWY